MSRPSLPKSMESSMPDLDTLFHQDKLQREDIYRQRVFGNNSGSFIEVEERRKLPPHWLVLFLLFIAVTWMYTFARLTIRDEYFIYEAIRRPFDTTSFRSDPQPVFFDDIDDAEDVQDWLLNAFPDIMAPEVQHFNMPLGQIRFTMRRMKMESNTDTRFNNYHASLWQDKDGISPEDTTDINDNPTSFGVYRVWARANMSLDWNYKSKPDKQCPDASTWIDMVDFSSITDTIEVEKNCRQWCEQLIRPLTCHCFEQSTADGRCNFYHVSSSGFIPASESESFASAVAPDPSVLVPKLESVPKKGLIAMFPLMKKFEFQNTEQGYRGTPGFVQFLSYYSQQDLLAMAKAKEITPSPPQRVMSSEIEDWIAGGYIGQDTVTVSADFATYNPNYEMFSWVQILFEIKASGYVEKSIRISSHKITKSQDLTDTWSIGKELDSVPEIAYIGLVLFYVIREMWRMSCCMEGLKYFASGWTWLTLLHLFLNVVTICFYLAYKGQTQFVNELVAMQTNDAAHFTTQNLISFSAQTSKYWTFKIAASFNMLFLAMQLLQYLHDIYPRVTVLVETVSDSFVPIFYFTVVCLIVFYGAIMWLYVWFGRKVQDFSTIKNSMVAVVSMTVGEFSSFGDVRSVFGLATFGFYIPYQLFMIIVILNFPRAVLNAGYADASAKHKEQIQHEKHLRAAKDSGTGADGAFRFIKGKMMNLKSILPEELSPKSLVERVRHQQGQRFRHKKSHLTAFCIFVLLYTIMCTMIISTKNSYTMTQMVEHALKVPTFSKFSPISGQVIRGSNFDSINSRNDVSKFLVEVLPTAMFFQSSGTFDGAENPLLNYSSSPRYKQLVISNWNILVGQKPVRLTAKLSKMKPLGNDAIKGVVSPDLLVRASKDPNSQSLVSEVDGLPDGQFQNEDSLSGVDDTKARRLLEKYCNYSFGYGATSYADTNGFVCMLDVNETQTMAELADMAGGLLTNQIEALSVDFLLYNAYAKTFAYVAIRFGFQPSGIIWKDVEVEPVSLELLTGTDGYILLSLMMVVMIMNIYYFLANAWELVKALLGGIKESKHKSKGSKIAALVREYVYFYLLDWFNLLDSVSCIATFSVVIMFLMFTSSTLSSYYFFQEEPVWNDAKCSSRNFQWCSDQEVITQFCTAKDSFRTFTRLCAFNTLFVYLRVLRYLKSFNHLRVIFSTLIRGLEDILWFVIVFFVGLMGYMLMGHIVFGGSSLDFSTKSTALRACLDIFLGTFDKSAMAKASLLIMIFYVLSYWFLFKLIFANMFLAIIDKHYRELDADRMKVELEARDHHDRKPQSKAGIFASIMGIFKKGATAKSEDAPAASVAISDASGADGEGGTGAVGTSSAAADTGGSGSATQDAPPALEAADIAAVGEDQALLARNEGVTKYTKDDMKNPNWQLLPDDVKDWSVEKANEINNFLHDLEITKMGYSSEANEAAGLDACMEAAETRIGELRKTRAREAHTEKSRLDSQELAELRKVHQDQESLSWYIMKRDAELKKLESAKELKQDRFDKMVKAANSFIKREEDVQAGDPQLSLTNR